MLEKDMVQSKLASLLSELTQQGEANWIRREVDPNSFYCFVNREKIKVEVFRDEGEDLSNCLEKPFVIFSIHYRDAEFRYFGDACNGNKIIKILKLVGDPVNDDEFQKLNHIWFNYWESHLLDDLTKFKNALLE